MKRVFFPTRNRLPGISFKMKGIAMVATFLLALLLSVLAVAQSQPSLTSDRDDYYPGDVAVLTGAGFQPGEAIDLSIKVWDPATGFEITDYDWTEVQADDQGGFIEYYTIPSEALGMMLTATAVGTQSGLEASVTFRDSPKIAQSNGVVLNPVSRSVTAGTDTVTYTVTINRGTDQGSMGEFRVALKVPTPPNGSNATFGENPLRLTGGLDSKSTTLTFNKMSGFTAGNYDFDVEAVVVNAAGVPITPADNGKASGTLEVAASNTAPVLASIGNKTVNELAQLAFTASANDTDQPANTLSFSLVGAPAGAAINPTTGAFSWTPTEAQGPGSYPFTVKVTDNGTPALSDEEQITVTVNEVNAAPVLNAVGNKSVNELTPLTFTASATDADLPANTLAFSLVGAPAGASIDAATGAFSWTPAEAQGPGTFTFKVAVSDGTATNDEEITVTVNEVNAAPVLGAIGNRSVNELAQLAFTASAMDPDVPANTLSFSLIGAPAGAAMDATTGAFSWTPTEAQGPGAFTFKVAVSDGTATDEEEITVTVNEVNAAPVLDAVDDESVNELTPLTFTASATDADLPANTLSFSLVGAPAGAAINPTTGAFSWTPTEAQGPGSYPFTVKVTDNGTPALSDQKEITVTVNEVNVAPVLAPIGNETVDELEPLTFTASATDADLPANSLSFSLVGAPSGASIDAATGAFSWTPTEAQGPGTFTFTVKVTDNGTPALSDDQEVTVTVNEVNAAPVLAAIGNKSVNELAQLAFTASAMDPDVPANTLSFSLIGAPAGAAMDATTGAFSWTPTEAQGPGSYTFKVKVTDNGTPALSDEEEITVTVKEVNTAPVLATIGNKTLAWGNALSFTANANDTDLPANTLTFSLVGAPAGASIGGSTGAFTWTPTSAQIGTHTFTVKVTDDGTPTLSDEEEITVTVNKRATQLTYTGSTSGQYSDPTKVCAVLVDNGGGALNGTLLGPNFAVEFQLESQWATALTNAAGVASTSITLNQGPKLDATVVAKFLGDGLYLASGDSDPYVIKPEDALVEYTGITYVATSSPTSSTASVTLSATVKDFPDGYPGDIRNAKVTFINRDTNTTFATESVGLVNSSDLTVGTATFTTTVNIGSADSMLYTIGVIAGGWYQRNASDDNVVITVSKPIAGTANAGGYLINSSSNGITPGQPGAKTNFGLNVKYNKKGTTLQGGVNIIIRNAGRVYQIKSNAILSLQLKPPSGATAGTAAFTGKANIQDITNPLAPISVDGNGSLQITMTDVAEPGQNADALAITLWNKDGGIWFSSNWNGTKTIEQTIDGGNIQIR